MKIRWIVLTSLLIVLIAPYLLAVGVGGDEQIFGGFLLNPMDGNSYLAKMNLGRDSQWLFTLPYTAEQWGGAFIFTFYIFLGWLAEGIGASNLLVFHLARILAAVGLFFALEKLARLLTENHRRGYAWMLVLLTFGGGLGWLVFASGVVTSDFWVAEAYPWLSMYSSPHFSLGMALLVWAVITYIQPIVNSQNFSYVGARGRAPLQWGQLWKLAVAGVLIAGIMPFGLVIGGVVLAGPTLWEWRVERFLRWQPVVAFGLLGGGYLLYQFFAIQGDPLLAAWNNQNLTPAPPIWDALISFSPALLVGIWGAWKLRERQNERWYRVLVIWLLAGLVLAYVPFNLQRRFLFAYFIPCATMAVLAIIELVNSAKAKKRWLGALVGASLVTNLLVLVLGGFGIVTHSQLYYLSRDEVAGFDWLERQTPPGSVIVAAPATGLYIPAWANRRVLYGHPFETVDAQNQEQAVVNFYSGKMSQVEADDWLKDNKVECVFWGPREKMLGVLPLRGLKASFSQGDVEIHCRGWAD